jgi:hypothetical protein
LFLISTNRFVLFTIAARLCPCSDLNLHLWVIPFLFPKISMTFLSLI